jgi:hypothetical protein
MLFIRYRFHVGCQGIEEKEERLDALLSGNGGLTLSPDYV